MHAPGDPDAITFKIFKFKVQKKAKYPWLRADNPRDRNQFPTDKLSFWNFPYENIEAISPEASQMAHDDKNQHDILQTWSTFLFLFR